MRRRLHAPLVLLAFVAGLVAGCAGSATARPAASTPIATAAPAGSAQPTRPSPTPVERPSTTPGAADAAALIDTSWGKAWDRIPVGFPIPVGARPATPGDPTAGPASAVYVTDLTVEVTVARIEAGLGGLGLSVDGVGSGEDGSAVLTLAGAGSCQAQVTVRPLGSVRFITVYYGAGCPRP